MASLLSWYTSSLSISAPCVTSCSCGLRAHGGRRLLFCVIRASLMGPSTGLANGPWRARHAHREPTTSLWPPPSCCGTQNLALSREILRLCRETFSSRHHLVNAMMATIEAGRGKKGKNFSANEERALCRSFLAVSQDHVCGNGWCKQWRILMSHFWRHKFLVCLQHSLSSNKWGARTRVGALKSSNTCRGCGN